MGSNQNRVAGSSAISVRLLLNILALASLLFLPWYITLCVLVVLMFVAFAYEVVAYAFIFDVLYGPPHALLFSFPLTGTVLVLVLFIGVTISKRHLSFYHA